MNDRQRWNERYQSGEHAGREPSPVVAALESFLPRSGRALDLAGGAGRHAVWLAERGLQVTLVDVSSVALSYASSLAESRGQSIELVERDLARDTLPEGLWDVILDVHYLQRALFSTLVESLAPNGLLVVVHPTVANLERHARPSARFLLELGELRTLLEPLEVLHYREEWNCEDRHEAVCVARRSRR